MTAAASRAGGRTLLILTEGGGSRGLGHVMRCKALADAWQDAAGAVRWVIAGDAVARAAAGEGADVRLNTWAQEPPVADGDVVAVDSYDLAASGRAMVARQAAAPLFFEDAGRDLYPRGLVVDARLSASAPAGNRATWLCGPRFQMLRAPFQGAPCRDTRERVERVLVVMGGTDAAGLSVRAARAVRLALPEARVAILGRAGDLPPGIEVLGSLDAEGVARAMADCDVAVSAAGQTVAELAALGVPTVLVQAADNQAANLDDWPRAAGFVAVGAADAGLEARIGAALASLADPETRAGISEQARKLIDGRGPERLVARILKRLESA